MRHAGSNVLPLLGPLLCVAACAGTQRLPGPLPPSALEALPDAVPSSQVEASVVRHSGPVRVQRPGAPTAFDLLFFRKRERALPHSAVEVGEGGRAEVLWGEGDGSLVLFDEARALLGDPSRGEALATLEDLSRAQVHLPPGAWIGLPGGIELWGDAAERSGPFRCERLEQSLLRVKNESRWTARVVLGGSELALPPLDAIDIPILSSASSITPGDARSGSPDPLETGGTSWEVGGSRIEVFGEASAQGSTGELQVVARGASAVEGLGVRVRLAEGEELALRPLSPRAAEEPRSTGSPPSFQP